MKRLSFIVVIFLLAIACKEKSFSPEGPTDVRISNLSDLAFEEVIINTSENEEDTDTLGTINDHAISDYFRFTKAYPKAEVSAKINAGGSLVLFSTGDVDFTYMQYIGQDRITYEVWISDYPNRVLAISDVIIEEPLVLK